MFLFKIFDFLLYTSLGDLYILNPPRCDVHIYEVSDLSRPKPSEANKLCNRQPSSSAVMVPLKSVIAICGTTGVGKSNLAIDLALHINRATHVSGWRQAKIINADAMQVYRGLDVITNKVPESERQGIKHLLMDFKQPSEQYVVGEWVRDTLKLVRHRFYTFCSRCMRATFDEYFSCR